MGCSKCNLKLYLWVAKGYSSFRNFGSSKFKLLLKLAIKIIKILKENSMPKLPEESIKGVGMLDDKYGKFSLSLFDFQFTIPSRFCILFSYNSNSVTRFSYYSAYSSFMILSIIQLKYNSMYNSIRCYVYDSILVLCSTCIRFEYCSYYGSCTVPCGLFSH